MIQLIYSDIAVGSREAFAPSATGTHAISHIAEIMPAGLSFPAYSTVCELNQTVLDGSMTILPEDTNAATLGLWSEELSDDEGKYTTPIALTMEAEGLYSSQGMTITTADAFPALLHMEWYRDDTLLASDDFEPDGVMYFCEKRVDEYNRVEISFPKTVLPQRRMKLQSVVHGRIREFDGKSLANVAIIQECSPISAERAINTMDFTLIGDSNIDYVFQSRQSLEIYNNGERLGVFFVSSYDRTAQRFYTVSSEDYFGLLEDTQFAGDIYTQKNAFELLTAIFNGARVPFEMDDALKSETVTGWIPMCSCREAVRQICFAIGAAADTTLSDRVRIFTPSDTVTHAFTPNEIMREQRLTNRDKKLTAAQLTVHAYSASSETTALYTASASGTGDNIFVAFNEPIYRLTITNGTIVESNANYAIINASSGCILSGVKYSHTTTVRTQTNPLTGANDPANVVSVEDMTLVNASNAAARLQAVYEYYLQQGEINSSLVMAYGGGGMQARPGDRVTVATEYARELNGRITSMRYNLYGGAIVAETTVH